MIYAQVRSWMPPPLRRYAMHFEAAIEDAVRGFGASLPPGSRVLDAGAGEGDYRPYFAAQRYIGLDLGVGDAAWDYSGIERLG